MPRTSAVGARIEDGVGVVTIVNNDLGPELAIDDVSVVEGTGAPTVARLAVRLTRATELNETVVLTFSPGSAAAGMDFDASASPLRHTFRAGGATTWTWKSQSSPTTWPSRTSR